MKALVEKYPELRSAFSGIVARATTANGQDYGTLLAMKDIRTSVRFPMAACGEKVHPRFRRLPR